MLFNTFPAAEMHDISRKYATPSVLTLIFLMLQVDNIAGTTSLSFHDNSRRRTFRPQCSRRCSLFRCTRVQKINSPTGQLVFKANKTLNSLKLCLGKLNYEGTTLNILLYCLVGHTKERTVSIPEEMTYAGVGQWFN